MYDPAPLDPADRRLSPEQVHGWLARTKAAFSSRSLKELAEHLLGTGAADGGEAAAPYVEALLRAFVTGRDEGIDFFFEPGREVLRRQVEAWLDQPPGTLTMWFSAALSIPSPSRAEHSLPAGDADREGTRHGKTDTESQREPRGIEGTCVATGHRRPAVVLRTFLDPVRADVETLGAIPTNGDTLVAECQGLLAALALELLERGATPDASVASPSAAVERALSEKTSAPRRRTLLALLTRFAGLSARHRWLHEEPGSPPVWRFEVPDLAILLVGEAIAGADEKRAMELRDRVGSSSAWALAAWAAVGFGDPLDRWTSAFVSEPDVTSVRDRALATAAAFGGLDEEPRAHESIRPAFEASIQALLAFFPPRRPDLFRPSAAREEESAWCLEPAAMMCFVEALAHGSRFLEGSLRPWDPESLIGAPGGQLGRLCETLDLRPRLTRDEQLCLAAIAAPGPSARVGRLDEVFFGTLLGTTSRLHDALDANFIERWTGQFAVEALRAADPLRAVHLLAVPAASRPAGYLLNRATLVEHWLTAWLELGDQEPGEVIVGAWIEAVRRLVGAAGGDETDRILRSAAERLRDRGLWKEAVQALRMILDELVFAATPDEARIHREAEVLRMAELVAEEARTLVERWTERPSLPWRSLLAADTPQDAIARWCVAKLRAKQDAPPGFRDGPVGVMTDGGEVTSTEAWQIAFQQADQALRWLLDHGDAGALRVLADACFESPGKAAVVDPKIGEWLRLTIPLSQVFWGRVLWRRAGRDVFFDWVERDRWPGQVQFVEGAVPYGTVDSLWAFLALRSLMDPEPDPEAAPTGAHEAEKSLFEALGEDEARRMSRAFAAWASGTWVFEPQWPSFEEAFRQAGRARPEIFPALFRPTTDFWAHAPPQRLSLCAAVLGGCAARGANVADALVATIERVMSTSADEETLILLGAAVASALRQNSPHSIPIAAAASAPAVLERMLLDGTEMFWEAIFRHGDVTDVLRQVRAPEGKDVGLGLLVALQSDFPDAIRDVEARRDFLRPLLLRAAAGSSTPSELFWTHAFARPPEERTLHALERFPGGRWSQELVARSATWSSEERVRVLRRLAGFATFEDVRRACVHALLVEAATGTKRA